MESAYEQEDDATVQAQLEAAATALGHGVSVEVGEIGFMRPCVGIQRKGAWVAYNPYSMRTFEPIHDDDRLRPGAAAPAAYHKDQYLAVLYDAEPDPRADACTLARAKRQLLAWLRQIAAHGEAKVVEYDTGAEGIQSLLSGTRGHHIVLSV